MLTDDPKEAKPERPAATGEKVRGMNASLTEAPGTGGLRERDPGRIHVTRRQVAVALILAVLAVVAAIFTVNAITAGATTYPAVVTTSRTYDLNFPTDGEVTHIDVKVGQVVKAGQVVASQDTTSLQNQLAAAQGVVTADQAALAQAQNPAVSPAQREQDQLQVQQAQTALSNAKSDLATAEAQGAAAVSGAQASVTAAEQLASTDQSRYNQACPGGPVPPAAGLTGAAFQAAESLYTHCQDLQLQLDRDLAAVSSAQAQVPVVTAQSQTTINQAQATVNAAQSTLNVAEYQLTLQSSPNDPAAVAKAQADLSQAQGQVQQIQASIRQAELVAPDNGVVAALYGAVGEYLGPSGVHLYSGPSQLPASNQPGFQLFPTATVPQSQSSAGSGTEPVIEIIGGQQQVEAQIPENRVSSLGVGRTVHVEVPALNLTVTGTVADVVLTPARSASSAQYDVFVNLSRTVAGLLPGMSATVRS